MDPLTVSLIAALASSVLSGIQAGAKQEQVNEYTDKLVAALKESLASNLALLQEQAGQYKSAEQLAITERQRQLQRELGLLNVSLAAGNVKGNSVLRQLAVSQADINKDISIRNTNIQNVFRQTLARKRALTAQTESQIAQALANKGNSLETGILSGLSTAISWLPTIAGQFK